MTIALAQHRTPGRGPAILFLPGYASDMGGTKALAIEAWAQAQGRACIRFDYRGCGASPGAFAEASFADWRADTLAMIASVDGPVVLVGSSLGGWLMLSAALAVPDRIAGLVGIAAAPDFTDWGFSTDEKLAILRDGQFTRANPYGPEPTLYTRTFWASGEAHRLMGGSIAIAAPVRLIHGMGDPDVPYNRSARLAELLHSADVQVRLIKDGDHRLSRERDIAVIITAIEELVG